MNTEVALIEKTNAMVIFTAEKGLDPILEKIRAEIDMFVPDLTTAKGRKDIASMAHKVSKSKTHLEKVGKELVDELKRQPKLIDAERKRMNDILAGWRDEVRKPLTDWENIDKERIARHEETITTLKNLPLLVFTESTSSDVELIMDKLEGYKIDESLEEYQEQAQSAYNATKLALMESIRVLKEQESAAIERERLAIEADAKALAEREEKIRVEAEAKAKAEAERKQAEEKEAALFRERQLEQEKKQAELDRQKAEQDKIAAEEKAKQDKIRAEQDRVDEARRVEDLRAAERKKAEEDRKAAVEAERQKVEAENAKREEERLAVVARDEADQRAREEDLEHRKKVNNKILEVLTSAGIAQGTAKHVITLAASNKTYNLKVIY